MSKSRIVNVASMSFKVFRENKILANFFESTVNWLIITLTSTLLRGFPILTTLSWYQYIHTYVKHLRKTIL